MKKIALTTLLIITALTLSIGQDPYSVDFSSKKISDDSYELIFTLDIEEGWHVYGRVLDGSGPIPMSFDFDQNDQVEYLTEVTSQQTPEIKHEAVFPATVELYDGKASFIRKVRINGNQPVTITGYMGLQACSGGSCIPPTDLEFTFSLAAPNSATSAKDESTLTSPETSTDAKEVSASQIPAFETQTLAMEVEGKVEGVEEGNSETESDEPVISAADASEKSFTPKGDNQDKTLLGLLLLGLAGGFLALLTPCVYPIIPLTVSFFMRDTSRGKAIRNGLIFGISIVLIYTLVGLIAGLTKFDPTKALASHWVPNLIFFLIFLALAFSFFGLFEITLPNSWSNKIDARADKGGFLGPFFMALATVIISFSCTGVIAGTVLGYALQGEILRPVIGMFGFGLAFALPFTLLAIFPGVMSKMPKSGGWLNAVKVVFAFILLASSIMFISNLRLEFFTREMAIAILIIILVLLGIYLLGKIKFSHDSDVPHVTIPRLLLSTLVFGFALRLLPGIFGYPLGVIDSYLPEYYVYDYNTSASTASASSFNICTDNPKYSDKLQMPHKLKGYFDYDEALSCAKELNKPVLLDFTGHTCKNCKYMHKNVFTKPEVFEKLSSEFVIATLFVDDKSEIPESDWVVSERDGKTKKTIGAKFHDLQVTKFGVPSQPYYVIVDPQGNVLTNENLGYSSKKEFLNFLDEGLKNFKN